MGEAQDDCERRRCETIWAEVVELNRKAGGVNRGKSAGQLPGARRKTGELL
jgi:hypothetical protein